MKRLNANGESFIELLLSVFIIGMTLTVIISIFISNRAAIVAAWNETEVSFATTNTMEELKNMPYATILAIYHSHQIDGKATKIDLFTTPVPLEPEYHHFEMQLDILPYKDYNIDELCVVKVRARNDNMNNWREEITIISNMS